MIYKRILTLCYLCISLNSSFGQAWTKEKGEHYYQLGFSTLTGKGLYKADGSTSNLSRIVTDQTIQAYGEYGLTDKITISSVVPFKLVKTGEQQNSLLFTNPEPATSLNSFGNIEINGYYGIKQNSSFVMSSGLKLSLPTTSSDYNSGLKTGYNSIGVAPTINLGYGSTNYFTQHSSSFNFRSNNYSNQFSSSTSFGLIIEERFLIIYSVDILLSMYNNGIPNERPFLTGLYVNNLEYVTNTMKFAYSLKNKIKIWASIGGGLWGSYVLKAPAITTAISYDF